MYERKTKDVYVLFGDYGNGYEEVLEEDTRAEANEQLKTYRENAPEYSFYVKKKMVPIVKEKRKYPCRY